MQNVYVLDSRRTPFGTFGGGLAGVPAPDLAAGVVKDLLERTGTAPEEIHEFIAGQVLTGGTGQAPARQAMRRAGLPDSVHAMTVNKVCGSGLQALMLAARAIRLGEADLVLAGGMENMSLSPHALPQARFGLRLGNGAAVDLMLHDALIDPFSGRHMGEIAEALNQELGISRQEQDDWAIRSYRRAREAIQKERLAAEIVPVQIASRKGTVTVTTDEEPFRVDFDRLASLRPVFQKDGTITAANASTLNDGAAFALLAGEETVSRRGLQPEGRLVAAATHSTHPDHFPLAPVGAIEKVCAQASLSPEEIGLFEINEAFASVTLMAIQRLKLDPERVNVNGGAVAIGHPVGASGGRLVATLLKEMARQRERYGLVTLCIGGGEAVAAIFERA